KKDKDNYSLRGMGPPRKIHKVLVSIRSSNERYQVFLKWARKMIPMDNDTRWNSWFLMCSVAIEPAVKKAIQRYQEQYHKEFEDEDILTPGDWEILKNIVDFLQPFYRVTKE
ncbi:hypothetical protein DM02DRAFT_503344, partial [Periconia macrospinosa]